MPEKHSPPPEWLQGKMLEHDRELHGILFTSQGYGLYGQLDDDPLLREMLQKDDQLRKMLSNPLQLSLRKDFERWRGMVAGAYPGSVAVPDELKSHGVLIASEDLEFWKKAQNYRPPDPGESWEFPPVKRGRMGGGFNPVRDPNALDLFKGLERTAPAPVATDPNRGSTKKSLDSTVEDLRKQVESLQDRLSRLEQKERQAKTAAAAALSNPTASAVSADRQAYRPEERSPDPAREVDPARGRRVSR
ncbi:hypothetical protein RJT17_35930 [Streptomyces sp. P5-A9]|uniref:hypothetical protein n=1 Tax=Streptomyces sp. P5-A9 TaxID=3071730 RepID=UPI002FCB8E96